MKRGLILVLTTLPCGVMLSALCYFLSLNSLSEDLHRQLQQPLTGRIIESGVNLHDVQTLSRYLRTRINQDLAHLQPRSPLSPISHCRAELLQLRGTPFPVQFRPQRHLQLSWTLPERDESLTLGLHCNGNPWLLSLPTLLLAGAALLAAAVHPPLAPLQLRCLRQLKLQGLDQTGALGGSQLVRQLHSNQHPAVELLLARDSVNLLQGLNILASGGLTSDDAIAWLPVAMDQTHNNLATALTICNAAPGLTFNSDNTTIVVHGVAIKLPATPFMYYLWYAHLRCEGDDDGGWFVNPPSNRPDRQRDRDLLALMQDHGGHHKAINDLMEKGLRAKTLDQNRSKVKDELVRVLGETLAQPYLFEVERDLATGRFKYRLALPAQHIQLPVTPGVSG